MGSADTIVIYRSVDREGATYALKPGSRERLKRRFGAAVHLRSRVFIAHETRAEYTELDAELGRQVVQLLTGVSQQRIESEIAPIAFRDPATDADIPLSAA